MATMVGRDADLRAVATAMAGAPPWAVVIQGPAGIGKTVLWQATLAAAPPSMRVLSARATHAESALGFTVLTDLLSTVPPSVFEELPAPQRDALAVATLRAAVAPDQPVDERAVSTAVASVLDTLAAEGPVVLAIDDVQWIDAASVGPIEFALRRAPVGLLATRRSTTSAPLLSAVSTRVHTVELAPLTVGALHHVVTGAIGRSLPRPALLRVAEASGGVPMYAIELARALERHGALSPGAPLPVPDTLAALTRERIAALDDTTRRAVLHVALAAKPTVELLRAVDAADGVEAAEHAGVVTVSRGRIELAHPLLAEAAIELASAPERRAAHAALAAVVDDAEARARHLALATSEPSDDVASALDAAVELSRARGATVAAAELARLAYEQTVDPNGAAALARAAVIAGLAFQVGDAEECELRYRHVLAHSDDPDLRAECAAHLTEVLWERGAIDECVEIARTGLDEVAAAPAQRAHLHLLASFLDCDRAANTDAAVAIASAHDIGPELEAWARYQQVVNEYEAGGPLDPVALDRVLAIERTGRRWRCIDQVANCRAVILKYLDELDAAADALVELHDRALEEGNEGQLPYVVGHLVGVHLRRGELVEAEAAAHRHAELSETTGQTNQRWQASVNLALIALAAGRFDDAEAAIADVAVVDDPFARRSTAGVVGTVRLRRGDAAGAVQSFATWWATSVEIGGDLFVSRFFGERVEALLATGDVDGATAFIDDTEERARRAGRRSMLAVMARSRGLVAAAIGDIDGALGATREALEVLVGLPMPLERAHTLLVHGRLLRRAKQKSAARDALEEATSTFDACGADGWAAVARDELARVNIRPPGPLELTASERRIAELAADGLTNRAIAAAAFVSTKTVEANLARVYRKLGIRSRAELGRRMAASD